MFRNYLLTAWKVYTRRKLFTAINLACITLTLGVLLVVTALLQNAFFPAGVEGKSERFVQIGSMVSTHTDGHTMRTGPLTMPGQQPRPRRSSPPSAGRACARRKSWP